MKTPAELSDSRLDSPVRHKQRSSALRRLAGGISNEILRVGETGLSEKELKVLRDAESILNQIASAYASAAKLAEKREQDDRRAEEEAGRLMASTFGSLTSLEDKLAFVAATQRHILKSPGLVTSSYDLDYYCKDSFSTLARSLSRQPGCELLNQRIADAWDKFVGMKAGLIDQYQYILKAFK